MKDDYSKEFEKAVKVNPQARLKEIKDRHRTLTATGLDDFDWLIARVEQLEKTLYVTLNTPYATFAEIVREAITTGPKPDET